MSLTALASPRAIDQGSERRHGNVLLVDRVNSREV
jgi:hypothetical protein